MKCFIDIKTTESIKNPGLITIGIVTEDNRTFEAEFNDYDINSVTDYVKENIIKYLSIPKTDKFKGERDYHWLTQHHSNKSDNIYEGYSARLRGNTNEIKDSLVQWFNQFDKIELYLYDETNLSLLLIDILEEDISIINKISKTAVIIDLYLTKSKSFENKIVSIKNIIELFFVNKNNVIDQAIRVKDCYNFLCNN